MSDLDELLRRAQALLVEEGSEKTPQGGIVAERIYALQVLRSDLDIAHAKLTALIELFGLRKPQPGEDPWEP